MDFQRFGVFLIVLFFGGIFILAGIGGIRNKKLGLFDNSLGRIMPESLMGDSKVYGVKGLIAIMLGVLFIFFGLLIIIAGFKQNLFI